MKIGQRMKKALAFAYKYTGWHTYHKNEHNFIDRLCKLGLVEIFAPGRQFRITEDGKVAAYRLV